MSPEQPQNPQNPNQYQPAQTPQPSLPPIFQASEPSVVAATTPAGWDRLFTVSLVLAVLIPIVGLIIGEVQLSKAKAIGSDVWRKKWKLVINLGAVMILLIFLGRLGLAVYDSRPGPLTKEDAVNYTGAIDEALNPYFLHLNTEDSQGNALVSYPTLVQFNDTNWRQKNGIRFDQAIISGGDQAAMSFIASKPTKSNQYGYVPTPAGCQNTVPSPCTGYSLTVLTTSGIYTDTITPKDYN